MSYTAHLETTVGIIRVYRPGRSHANGDKYDWCATVVNLGYDGGREVVELRGVMRAPTIREARAVQDCLREAGFNALKVERWKVNEDGTYNKRFVRLHKRAAAQGDDNDTP